MNHFTLDRSQTGLIVVDVQDKLFAQVERGCEILPKMQLVIKGFQILNLPILVTEQYPKGLGPTIATLKVCLDDRQEIFSKTTFSGLQDAKFHRKLLDLGLKQWVLMGLEAHVCILQTAKDLLKQHFQVVVLNDAISSRSLYDFSTAIAELRDCGIRISSAETVLFELLKDATCPEFKPISQLIKTQPVSA